MSEYTEKSSAYNECEMRMKKDMGLSYKGNVCGMGVPLSVEGSMMKTMSDGVMTEKKTGGKKTEYTYGKQHSILGNDGTNGKIPITKKAKSEIA